VRVWNPWHGGAVSVDVMVASLAPAQLLNARRQQRLASLLERAAQGSPLYRRIIGKRDPRSMALHEMPVLCKAELMGRFDEWVTEPRLKLAELRSFVADPHSIGQSYLGRYTVWESSGSTGVPGVFVQDESAMTVYDALEMLRRPRLQPMRRWLDPWYTTERLAFVGATTGHFASTASVERLCRINPWMAARLRSFSFLQPMPRLLAELRDHAPTVLATYPTTAWLLAEEAEAGRLSLPLQEVWTGGEALTPAMRAAISHAFGCPVAQSYGASEFLALASECRCGQLHLNSDWAILESVDERHRPVPMGEPGSNSLLTNLANRVQPLIRYELGDRITLHDRCDCGSALPRVEVEGRVDDAMVLDTSLGHRVRVAPLALTTVLEEEAELFDFQLIQQSGRSLLLQVSAQGQDAQRQVARARRALKRYLDSQGLTGVSVDVRCGATRSGERSGKAQRVVAHAP
jgi:phenylacetate-coenzyme A ligase PaaK-like adenylate-forming protein